MWVRDTEDCKISLNWSVQTVIYLSSTETEEVEKCCDTTSILRFKKLFFSLIDGLKTNRHGIFKILYCMSHKNTIQASEKKRKEKNFSVVFKVLYPTWRWTKDTSEHNGQRWMVETSAVCLQITSTLHWTFSLREYSFKSCFQMD